MFERATICKPNVYFLTCVFSEMSGNVKLLSCALCFIFQFCCPIVLNKVKFLKSQIARCQLINKQIIYDVSNLIYISYKI
jgi:hypothetical protein